MRHTLLLLLCAVVMAGCAEPASRQVGTFRVVHFVPELKGAAVYGYMRYDSLAPSLKEGAARLGYKPGDEVPTKRYSDDHPDRTIYFLKPPAKDLKTRNPNAWVAQGR